MNWNIDYDTKRTIFRVLTIVAGLICIFPVQLDVIANFRLFDGIYLRMFFGVAAITFAVGSWKKWW